MPLNLTPYISAFSNYMERQNLEKLKRLKEQNSIDIASKVNESLSGATTTKDLSERAMTGYNAALASGHSELIPVINQAASMQGMKVKSLEEEEASKAYENLWLQENGKSMFRTPEGSMTNGITYFNKLQGLDPKIRMQTLQTVRPLKKTNAYQYDPSTGESWQTSSFVTPTGETVGDPNRIKITSSNLKDITDERVLSDYRNQMEYLDRKENARRDDNKPKLYGEVMFPGEDGTMTRGVATARLVGNEFRLFSGGKDITDVAYKAPKTSDYFKSNASYGTLRKQLQTDQYRLADEVVGEFLGRADEIGSKKIADKIKEMGYVKGGDNSLSIFNSIWGMKNGVPKILQELKNSDNPNERQAGLDLEKKAFEVWTAGKQVKSAEDMWYNVQNGYTDVNGNWTAKGKQYLAELEKKKKGNQPNQVTTNPQTGKIKVEGE